MSVRNLKRQAREAAKFRGHKMSNFVTHHNRYGAIAYYSADCKKCGACMFVTSRPLPNETEVSGSAVAINCSTKEK